MAPCRGPAACSGALHWHSRDGATAVVGERGPEESRSSCAISMRRPAKSDLDSTELGPCSAMFGSTSIKRRRLRRIRLDFGQRRPEFCRTRAKFGRNRTKCGRKLSEFGRRCPMIGRIKAKFRRPTREHRSSIARFVETRKPTNLCERHKGRVWSSRLTRYDGVLATFHEADETPSRLGERGSWVQTLRAPHRPRGPWAVHAAAPNQNTTTATRRKCSRTRSAPGASSIACVWGVAPL